MDEGGANGIPGYDVRGLEGIGKRFKDEDQWDTNACEFERDGGTGDERKERQARQTAGLT